MVEKILQAAPIDIALSPVLRYAGTERIIDGLNQGYSIRGYDSIVACSGDSDLGGYGQKLVTAQQSLWATSGNGVERAMVRSVDAYKNHFNTIIDFAVSNGVEILHDHPGQGFAISEVYKDRWRELGIPLVTTIHHNISPEELKDYKKVSELKRLGAPAYFIGISNSHRRRMGELLGFDFDETVYNGLSLDKFSFTRDKLDYLFWIGRVSSMKGADLAVRVAQETGLPLVLAGEVHNPDKDFYEEKILPYVTHLFEGSWDEQEGKRNNLISRLSSGEGNLFGGGEIYFIGPVNDFQKNVLYANARAAVLPNRWEEPFGLTFIEAMATGTPVYGTALGAVPELVVSGETGFLADASVRDFDDDSVVREISSALRDVFRIRPVDCRQRVEEKFSVNAMVDNYLRFYDSVLTKVS